MQKVTPFLTFKDHGEEAVKFYVSLFKNSKINNMMVSEGDGRLPKGYLQFASFALDGQEFFAMDGDKNFSFALGSSLFVDCEDQAEVDRLWSKLSEGGEELPCGWVKDRYGMPWQIIPAAFSKMMQDPDANKRERVIRAMFKMKKMIIKDLEEAYKG